ncbi:MAG: NAD-dependent malic enzyme [Verrucomicrobia bacterium]|nr:NAD-dependent malic enzyme [Verrucomicrobiota bacterium]MBU6446352.1 NAD-dependent malic enzyme [Verrucomicrobiota bacterium]MDE3047069.1 NAD-dependent malic enzyme [Verrucomicrobiota bacterium]
MPVDGPEERSPLSESRHCHGYSLCRFSIYFQRLTKKKEKRDITNVKEKKIQLNQKGAAVLNHSLLNKGTAFTQEERDQLGLNGLLPPVIASIEDQIQRSYINFHQKRTPLEKYENLIGLMSRNELLFYQFIARYPDEVLPIIYTPTVGDAAVEYSRIYFHQRGLYLSYPFRTRLDECFSNYSTQEVDVIVVTDGERILGLGDQGIGGMTIPIGKLSLYTLFGGIHPARTLPILLDVGTNNAALLNDPLYLGWRHPRVTGKEYDAFLAAFIRCVKKYFPKTLLQWEDFGRNNAKRVLETYREQILSFNDDIQGTAAVTTAGLLSACQMAHLPFRDVRVAIMGGGSAGTGIAEMIVHALIEAGVNREEAHHRIYLVDVDGLVHFGSPQILDIQKPFVQSRESLAGWKTMGSQITLLDVVRQAKPHILIGVCGQGGVFKREIVEEMARHTPRPILFPLSNPTPKAECTPEEVFAWTRGQGIVATGSPFPPVMDRGKTYPISQCNNVYIFPGLGLGAIAAQASKITDGMFLAAMHALADESPALKDPTAPLFPRIQDVRAVSFKIAHAVAKKACAEGVAHIQASEVDAAIRARIWEPHYPIYERCP